jgi:adenylate cyclase
MKLWSKLAIALLAIALVPTVALAYLLSGAHATELARSAREYRLAAADAARYRVETFLAGLTRELAEIGSIVTDGEQSEARRLALVKSKLASARSLDRVDVFSPDGTFVLGMQAEGKASGAAKVPKTLAAAARTDATAKPGTLHLEQDAKSSQLTATVAIKTAAGKVYGLLRAKVPLKVLADEILELGARRFGEGAENIFVVDRQHRLLIHRDGKRLGQKARGGLLRAGDPEQFTRNISYGADVGRGAQRRLAIVVPVPSVQWGIVVQQSHQLVYASVTATWRRAGITGGVIALLAIIIGLLLGRRMAKPVTELSTAAARVAEGDFEVRVAPRSNDEVGTLGRSFNSMAGNLQESRDKLIAEARVRGDMSRYLPDQLVDAIVTEDAAIELGGKRSKVTVLFADVVAFTPLAERHAPEEIVRLLNELFTFLTEIVFKHGGMVDKFIGDCVMAVFGVPEAQDDDAERAALAALEMIDWLEAGNAKWAAEFGRELQLAIGVNTGTAIVGNLGSQKRMEYTAIGDTVNIAARLEMLAKPGQILVSSATAGELDEDDFELLDLGERDITGREERIQIFELREDA